MRTFVFAAYVASALFADSRMVVAADIGRLEWGGFVVENDSSNGYQDIKSASSDDGHTLKLTFSALEAKADGSTTKSTAIVSGHYELSQPKRDKYSRIRVQLAGHIIKSNDSVAKLVLKLGGVDKTIEWPMGTAASEKYTRSITVALPANGRLPSPFLVSVQAHARKHGSADAAYVSVSRITITAQLPRVAAN